MSKASILYLLDILKTKTDAQHPLTSSELIQEIYERSSSTLIMERKTIYRDIQTLIDYGYDIIQVHEQQLRGYYLLDTTFEVAEVRLLIDAINASTSISTKKTQQLTKKLQTLVNEHEAKDLPWNIRYANSKSNNEHVLYNVDAINQAILHQQAIQFQYFDWNIRRQKIMRKKTYQLIPYALVWDQDKYYCVLYSEKHQSFSNYRIDKMDHIEPIETSHQRIPFDLQQYMKNSFGMFLGERTLVTLKCHNDQRLASHLLERFGDDIIVKSIDDDSFTIVLEVELSPVFYGWIFQWLPDIEIIAPSYVQQQFQNMCIQGIAKNN
ncbi:MAG: WYL domain-containing protein [Erysipelotrichaceae bacterium]|nr:WYL domain-containing protein [Erysipelotrichaceae bacterium]